MDLAVILTFDEATTATLRALQKRIREVRAAPPAEGSVPPHVTLGGVTGVEDDTLPALLAEVTRVADSVAPLPAHFPTIGAFPGDAAVLFLAPVVRTDLMTAHQRIDRLLAATGGDVLALYRPGKWVPHCTLAMDLTTADLGAAIGALTDGALPLSGTMTDLAVFTLDTGQELARYPLSGS